MKPARLPTSNTKTSVHPVLPVLTEQDGDDDDDDDGDDDDDDDDDELLLNVLRCQLTY